MRIDNPAASTSQQDLLAQALGVKEQAFALSAATSQPAIAAGQVFGTAIYLPAGVQRTGLKMRNSVAAAGTAPTTVRLCLADSTGKVVVLTGNVNTAASWPLGVCTLPFTAAYTVPNAGVYYACVMFSGTYGTTSPVPVGTAMNNPAWQGDGILPSYDFVWTGQTDLPAVNSSLTITSSSGRMYWFGTY